jgi:hypothetical protein
MKYFLDTEFDETSERLFLISLALRAEDGRELYLISSEFSRADCNEWVQTHVLPKLITETTQHGKPCMLSEFPTLIESFIGNDYSPEFWGWISAYDWVLFCRLWGTLLNIPPTFPYNCFDCKQLVKMQGMDGIPAKEPEAHNALVDARWIEKVYRAARNYSVLGSTNA